MTIKDIAREAGYAVGTVSRVINNNPNVSQAARARILEVIQKYNFQPNSNAKHLKQQASQGIAMIVKGTHNMLFAPILEKMQTECTAAGYSGMVYYIDENDNEVDRARQILAVYDGSPGGTRYTLNYAMDQGLDILLLDLNHPEKAAVHLTL